VAEVRGVGGSYRGKVAAAWIELVTLLRQGLHSRATGSTALPLDYEGISIPTSLDYKSHFLVPIPFR